MIAPVKCSILFLLAALSALSVQAVPSLVKLDSGEQLLGEVLPRSDETRLVLRSELLGEIELPRERIRVIEPQAVSAEVTAVPTKVGPAAEPDQPTAEGMAAADVRAEANSADPGPPEAVSEAKDETEAMARQKQMIQAFRELKAPDIWSGNLRIGINVSSGDNKWTESYARGKLEIKPKQSPHFFRFGGSYTYRESERSSGERFKSTDRYDAEFTYRRNFGEGAWFFQNALGGRVDQIKGIKHEVQDTVGIGYQYKPSDAFEFLLGGGGGVEDLETTFEDTRSGFNTVMNVFQEATWRPIERTSLVQRFNYYWNPDDSAQFNYVLTAAIRVRLTDLLGLEFSYNKNFDNDVGNGSAQDDTQWRNALVVYF
jgi:putative salt-induced outer membrane protein YdiY